MAAARELFDLIVRDREKILFSGKVTSITSFNEKGTFDVLAHHANFISLISKALIVRTPQGNETKILLNNGVIRVVGDKVDAYLGIKRQT